MKYAISSCLMGVNCKYNGGNNANTHLMNFMQDKVYFLVCPEEWGGLPTPRSCCEIKNGCVRNIEGTDVSKEFYLGARMALKRIMAENVDVVILQPRSPSCGIGQIYDGNFTKTLIDGDGIFARILKENGVSVKTCDGFLADIPRL